MIDLAVLGAGSAGYAAAIRAARLGLDVALIDPGPLGGTCLHAGCIPTKAWLHAAGVRRTVRGADAFGIAGSDGEVDAKRVRAQADAVVEKLHRGVRSLISGSGVRVIAEHGRFITPGCVAAGDERIEARAIVVATGAEPTTLGLLVDGERILTSDHALRLTSLPERAVVIGGGVIGVEFASLWNDLGVNVTLLEAAERILPSEDPALVKVLAREFASRGIRLLQGMPVRKVTATADGVQVSLPDETLESDIALVAVGRTPRTKGLGLEEVGVKLDGKHIVVDENLRTDIDQVYAIGDVVRGPQLAHRGYAHGMYVAAHIAWRLGKGPKPHPLPADRTIPRVTYSSPQLASVGVRTFDAGPGAREVTYFLSGNGKTLLARGDDQKEPGLVKVVVDASGRIVGVHAVGEAVAELITAGAMHVGWGSEPEDIFSVVHPHPSVSESLAEAIMSLAGRPLHMRA